MKTKIGITEKHLHKSSDLLTNILSDEMILYVKTRKFHPAFYTEPRKNIFYYLHSFVISIALSWFWVRFKGVLTGSFISRGIEFGLIYSLVAVFPMMWLIYSAMNVSLGMVTT